MRRNLFIAVGALFVAGVLFAKIALEQSSSGDGSAVIRTEVNLVELHAAVTDETGHLVTGLAREAFQLLVDDAPHPIVIFRGEDAPVTAGIVLDNSASMAPKESDVIAAALTFAKESNPLDKMFVVHFGDHVRLGLPPDQSFTDNVSILEGAVSNFQLGGTTALYDALLAAIAQARSANFGRKVLLVITDGGDNSSKAHLSDVLDSLRQDPVAIYPIGLFASEDRDAHPEILSQIAEDSGGQAFFPSTTQQASQTCIEIAKQIRAQYTFAFVGADDGKYHNIKVLASDPSHKTLTVETRAGYFASKP